MSTKHERIAATLAQAAAAIREGGVEMERRAHDWRRGPAAQNLDPDRRGWRYERCGDAKCRLCPHPVPGDPTGEGAGRRDQAAGYADELDALLRSIERDARRLVALAMILVPPQPRRAKSLKDRNAAGADVAAEGWCRSCWRNDQTCTPIEQRPDGTAYYRDRCRWCGAFHAEHGQDPPLAILRQRHDGRRISQADIDRALRKGEAKTA